MQSPTWIIWNLFLSAIPVGLAYLWTYCMRRYSLKRKGVHWAAFTPLVAMWIAFLPNTCYLLTEWRHFLFDSYFVGLRDAVESDRTLMLRVARQGLFFLCYSGFGVLCLVYAIRPAEQFMTRLNVHKAIWMTPLFLITSLGVYLGLIVRLNSWDLLTRPLWVGHIVLNALLSALLLKTIVIFAFLLWACYEIANIWADGLALRIKQKRVV
jgi:uncharacterized membrane protein